MFREIPLIPILPSSFDMHARRVDELNGLVADQNQRLAMVDQLQDPEFRDLARTGLVEEQLATVGELRQAATEIPYEVIATESLRLRTKAAQLEEAESKAQEEMREIQAERQRVADVYASQLELLARIAPDKEAEAFAILDSKRPNIDSVHAKIDDLRKQLIQVEGQAQAADETITLTGGKAWPIPQALGGYEVPTLTSTQIAETAATFMEPDVNGHGETSKQPSVEAEKLADAFLAFAIKGELFNVGDVREAIPELAEIAKRDGKSGFKKTFEMLCQQVIANLEAYGISAAWEKTGRTKGSKYRLVMEDDSPLTSPHTAVEPASNLEEKAEPLPDDVIAMQFKIGELIIDRVLAKNSWKGETLADILIYEELRGLPESVIFQALNDLVAVGPLKHMGRSRYATRSSESADQTSSYGLDLVKKTALSHPGARIQEMNQLRENLANMHTPRSDDNHIV